MFLARRFRLLWLLVAMVVTPIISLPWNTIGRPIAAEQEDDDDGRSDDGETLASCAPGLLQGRSPRLPAQHDPAHKPKARPIFSSRQQRLQALAFFASPLQKSRVRLQI